MIAEKLRKAVLKAAMEGKLSEQFDRDGNAIDLINQIKKDRGRLLSEKTIKYSKLKNKNVIDINIPKNWVITNINEIAFVTKLAGFEYTKYIANNLVESGVPLFKGKNIQNGKMNLEFESYIPKLVSQLLSRSRLDRKCLLTPYVGTIGNIAIFEADFEAHLGSNVGKIELFNHFRKNILEEYLLFFLRSEYGDAQLKRNKKATAQESISIQDIREVSVPIPPIEEQKRIVEKLEVLLAEIDRLEQDEKALKDLEVKFPEKLKNAILRNAVSGKLTNQNLEVETTEDIIVLLEKKKNEKIELIKSYNKQPFDIPENWRWIKIGDLGTMGMGQTLLKKDMVEKGDPVYSATISDDPLGYVKKDNNKLKLTKGDFVIPARGASIGYVNLIKVDEASSTQTTMYIKSYLPSISNYIYYCLLGMKKDVFTTTGTAQPQITVGLTKEQLIPLPPLEEQKRIVEKLDELFKIDLLNT
ncbi:Restriction endonuclease S subunit [Paracholeplasma brassicae]|uniref:Restriction endonuclease S subunit n=1 Tax=Acholeplasma brassicae TaxID=61635 RepID=U4KNC3_9MOLU|nr:restriction endonuclease subunit S [Paracholeplasma brassicae]CCV65760.1 Restriction endonuclease S subunit [Paracholeplasma brassicae]